jgi:regulator-associated protein of mTOR
MKPSEADEPGSTDYNERLWRRNRNDRIIAKTQPQKETAGSNAWDRAKGFFNNGTQPVKMVFHQFEDHLVVTDDKDGIGVWDWKKAVRLNRFSNGNPGRSRITEVRLINEDDQALLMTGSSDGVMRLFRNYERAADVELVTAFRALTDLEPSNKAAGLVFDWQQSRGLILVALRTLSVHEHAPVFAVGTDRHCVRVFSMMDMENGNLTATSIGTMATPTPSSAIVATAPTSTITNSAVASGAVNTTIPNMSIGSLSAGARLISSFEPYSSFLHQSRGSPIAATAFHPHRMMIAGAALGDTHVNIYACRKSGDV